MSFQDLQEVIDTNSLSVDVAQKYLKLYIADIDWRPHIASLWSNAQKKFKDDPKAREHVKNAIACATLLPTIENTTIPDPPSNLLFWCTGWKQFHETSWFDVFVSTLEEDIDIVKKRNKIIQLGIIDPIDIPPMTRQAFNWLYERAADSEHLTTVQLSELREKLANLVRVYGGATVCNIFINHKSNVQKVYNWRSGYFFEKQIHKVYTVEQITALKKAEILKTNPKCVKTLENKVGISNG